ncbi:hypothetical protein [Streptomyces sp. NPDC093707]|uniref:hypothetical protein n=1 Tax=Streptomyces sp. NPDC093707 TaxID=3154984 RepID=UPI003451032C
MSTADDRFPATLDAWTSQDWAEYREQVAAGEGITRALDAVNGRRRREARQATGAEVSR